MATHVLFLFVGDPYRLFTLHTNLLPAASKEYLNTRFHLEQVYWFGEEDPAMANLWRLYLYTGKVFSHDEAVDQDDPDLGNDTHADGEWTKLAHAYFFGRKVQDENFANACVTALIEKVQATERFPTGIASEVYTYTSQGDKLRELIVDLHVWMGESTCLQAPHEDADAPMEFHQHARREARRAGGAVYKCVVYPWETDPCAYHEHSVTKICAE